MKVERIVERQERGCIVLDIDDTMIKADASQINIYKTFPNGKTVALSTDEFAKDPDSADEGKSAGVKFDFRDFRDPKKILSSIENGTPLIKNLKIMDKYVNRGWDVSFLTARGQEDLLYNILKDKIMYRGKDGKLRRLGNKLNKKYSAAINDEFKVYDGATGAEKKANVLKKLCSVYDKVLYVDDDVNNIKAAAELKLPNLKIVKSWTESLEEF